MLCASTVIWKTRWANPLDRAKINVSIPLRFRALFVQSLHRKKKLEILHSTCQYARQHKHADRVPCKLGQVFVREAVSVHLRKETLHTQELMPGR